MQTQSNVTEDLGYVRGVVRGASTGAFPAAIAYLWAAIGLVGFSLIDFAPDRVPLFWIIAAPLGFLLSAWLGWRHGRRVGQESRREGARHMLHWGALLVAIFLLYPLIATGALRDEAIAQVILLMAALAYFLGGLHLVPALRWAALAMVLGFIVTVTVDRFAWTALGILFAIGLIITARVAGESRGQRPA
jgi:hypothetical protein